MDINYYLSREWILGDYECWAFVCDFYYREFGVELPLINLGVNDPRLVNATFSGSEHRDLFEQIDEPEHGCILELGRSFMNHVGVWVETADGPRVLHCREKVGGLFEKPTELDGRIKIFTYNRLRP